MDKSAKKLFILEMTLTPRKIGWEENDKKIEFKSVQSCLLPWKAAANTMITRLEPANNMSVGR